MYSSIKYYLYSLLILVLGIIIYQPFTSNRQILAPTTRKTLIEQESTILKDTIIQVKQADQKIIHKNSSIRQRIETHGALVRDTVLSARPDNRDTVQEDLAAITPAELWSSPITFEERYKYRSIEEGLWKFPVKSSSFTDQVEDVVLTGASDVFSLVTSPLKWDSKSLLTMALVTSGTMLLYSIDDPIHKNFTNGGTPSNSDLIRFGNFYGETRTTEMASLGIGAYGIIFNDKKAMQLGLEIFESYFIAEKITALLKYSLGRSRPSYNNGPYEFRMFDRGKRFCALPSGHSTLAFSMSTVLASYTDDTHLKIIIYLPAFITAFSRLYDDQHWASDVFLGAAIGHFVGKFLTSRHNPFYSQLVQFGLDKEGRPGIRLSLDFLSDRNPN